MRKQELIDALEAAMTIEEEHARHILAFFMDKFDWSCTDPQKSRDAIGLISVIRKQSEGHFFMIQELLQEIKESYDKEF